MMQRRYSLPAILLIAIINLYFLVAVRICDYNGTNWQTIIYSDGRGYYEYLRAAFINHNLSDPDSANGFVRITDHGPAIKFFAGTALAYAPFFGIGYLLSSLNHAVTDGYNIKFQILIAAAGYVYLLLGLLYLRKWLLKFFFSEIHIAIVLLLITYGTNLFYYAIFEPSMSHVYAFAFISLFLYNAQQYFISFRLKNLIAASISIAIIILIRPVNLVILLMIPAFCSRKSLLSFFRNYQHVIISLMIFTSLIFLQFMLWYLQTKRWIMWSYDGEGFYFLRPAIGKVLFSFNKGWFTYTPLALIAVAGFIPLWGKHKAVCISVIVTLCAALYFTSAWWCWNYGDSFGMRPVIDFYSLLALPLASLIASAKGWLKLSITVILSFVVLVSVVQTYQYYNRIMQHYSMDWEKYRYIFMKTGHRYKNVLGGNIDLIPYTTQEPELLYNRINEFSAVPPGWNNYFIVTDPDDSMNKCVLFNQDVGSIGLTIPSDTVIENSDMLYVKVSLRRYEPSPQSSAEAKFVAVLRNKSEVVFNYDFKINDLPSNQPQEWKRFEYAFWIRKPHKPFDELRFEIQNPQRRSFLVDDAEIKIYRMFQ